MSGAYQTSWDECEPARPVPAIIFHGTADRITPYQGSASSFLGLEFPSIPSWVLTWALRNSCHFSPVPLTTVGDVSGVKYRNDVDGADIVFYTIHGGGHTWPGGKYMPKLVVGPGTKNIDATRLMWDFFSRHRLE